MDWAGFIRDNSAALLALVGVALGGIIGAAASLLTLLIQRRWQARDQRSEWRRNRLREQLDIVISWQDQWLRVASHLRSAEGSPEDVKRLSRRARRAEIDQLSTDIQDQSSLLRELNAITVPIVSAVGDSQLTDLSRKFRDTAARYQNILEAQDVETAVRSNIIIIAEASELNARIRERAEYLLLMTFRGPSLDSCAA